MEQIKTYDQPAGFRGRVETLRQAIASGMKWWAEHQAWPATEEIRVDRHRSTCG